VVPLNPSGLFCATATAEDIDLVDPGEGRITAISEANAGSLADET
jgi:hypothetical protein